MPEAGLAEPLLQRTDAPLPTHNATQLEVFRQSGSQLIVRSKVRSRPLLQPGRRSMQGTPRRAPRRQSASLLY